MTRPSNAPSTAQTLSTRRPWRRLAQTLLGAVLAVSSMATHASDWPDRPIRLIVPSAPGGGTDNVVREVKSVIQAQTGEATEQIKQRRHEVAKGTRRPMRSTSPVARPPPAEARQPRGFKGFRDGCTVFLINE